MFIFPSFRQDLREKRSSAGKRITAAVLASALLLGGCGVSTDDKDDEDDVENIVIERPYDPTAMHIADFDILVPRDENSYEGGTNFWNLYFFDTDGNIYVDQNYEVGVKAIVLQVHTFSYNKVGDVFYYDVYIDGELVSEKNIFTNKTDLADYCDITYEGDGNGLTKGRYTFVIYDVNSTSTVCCVAYCVVR